VVSGWEEAEILVELVTEVGAMAAAGWAGAASAEAAGDGEVVASEVVVGSAGSGVAETLVGLVMEGEAMAAGAVAAETGMDLVAAANAAVVAMGAGERAAGA